MDILSWEWKIKVNCVYEHSCLNEGTKCLRCSDANLYKPNSKQKPKPIKTTTRPTVLSTDDDSWKDLEQKVADAINRVPDVKDAHRSLASGALWFQKGDVIDDILHPEAKERIGAIAASGADKTFSIKKSWLEKAREEALQSFKTMCLPFRFKLDDFIYIIFRLDDIAELVTHMKAVMFENRQLKAKIMILEEEILKGKEIQND